MTPRASLPTRTTSPCDCSASGPRRSQCCWHRRLGGRGRARSRRSRDALLTSGTDEASLSRRARALGIDLHAVGAVAVVDPNGSARRPPRRLLPASPPSCGAGRPPMRARSSASSRPAGGRPRGRDRLPDRTVSHDRASPPAPGARPRSVGAPGGPPDGGTALALDRAAPCAGPTTSGSTARSSAARGALGSRPSSGPRWARSSTDDLERQRDLAPTLETYLEQARHDARTCDVLHIHANTLYQRLDRITKVLGPHWKEPGRALELQVALRLHRLLAARPD